MDKSPTSRFSNRADDYARHRPTYPREIIDAILCEYERAVVADLGAGTGISAHLLRDAGATVYAIEPNVAMRAEIVPDNELIVLGASAEATGLANASVDIVTAFQSYHWFDPNAVLEEARRIMRTRGRFAAVWNHRDRSDGFTGAYETIVDRFDESRGSIDRSRRSTPVLDDLRRHGWTNPRLVSAAHRRALDWETLIGVTRSSSYLPKTGPAYAEMERELRALFERWPTERAFIYVTDAYLAERPSGE
jgi:SAM-dependent methyltransferase